MTSGVQSLRLSMSLLTARTKRDKTQKRRWEVVRNLNHPNLMKSDSDQSFRQSTVLPFVRIQRFSNLSPNAVNRQLLPTRVTEVTLRGTVTRLDNSLSYIFSTSHFHHRMLPGSPVWPSTRWRFWDPREELERKTMTGNQISNRLLLKCPAVDDDEHSLLWLWLRAVA